MCIITLYTIFIFNILFVYLNSYSQVEMYVKLCKYFKFVFIVLLIINNHMIYIYIYEHFKYILAILNNVISTHMYRRTISTIVLNKFILLQLLNCKL